MKDYMNIGSSPVDEPCAQIGTDGYYELAQKECKAFVNQLLRVFGKPPQETYLKVKGFDHDFGRYYEVVVVYDDNHEEGLEYALKLEGNTPEKWDEEAKDELLSDNPPERERPADE